MTETITISGSVIAALIISALLCVIIPIVVLIIYKKKNREIKAMNAFWGGLAFFVFALVLERLLHMVMQPILEKNDIWFTAVYGAFAAGIFEETARFIVFKTIMRKDTDPRNSIMYGIGHGGMESVLVGGLSLFILAVIGITVNSVGLEETLRLTGAYTEEAIAATTAQITALQNQSVGMFFVSVLERCLAMVLHVGLSVWVFRAAKEKGKVWLYPAAILIHAAADFPAVLVQGGIVPIWVFYILMAVFEIFVCFIAYKNFKAMKKRI